ncbi:4-alpha-glucanotransferase [Methylococcus geothermalis]|uniref:4-alpha-glucanotransferase n=1 Tax=Methylococcus geothermalis TaxID=2681310 RepID=A0A858Q8J7_9GAMM|nr:4-alpha-glucanotransferase [Methylococcus geothermalis]QJD30143.1 4-alpha-glucanotransferase [Methylococcus geothermalis]
MDAHGIFDRRRAGILLHISSLPGGPGNGDLGADAFRFVDFLAAAGVTVWQTLPINPTHEDGSPYQCTSVHAGNPLLIGLDWLVERGLLEADAIPAADDPVTARQRALRRAFESFRRRGTSDALCSAFGDFVSANDWWLADYALYAALKEVNGGLPWQAWPPALRDRKPDALASACTLYANTIARVRFEQFVFFEQWHGLHEHAKRLGVLLFGDMPIFVASDSAEVWAGRDYFELGEDGEPRVVAGVPPDYFSATGQRWGNPHYNWDNMARSGFSWWIDRLRTQLGLYDLIRIDHFRGFEAYWEIPACSETAMEGRWVKAPGEALLARCVEVFGESLPLVAEDLGIITAEVESLRRRFRIPGMRILQFAFEGGSQNPYLPHNHAVDSVVYTGTHDNDTTLSWFEGLSADRQSYVYDYLGRSGLPMPAALVQAAMASVARLAIVPMQDVLGLGQGHRMNTPGTVGNNWHWRFDWAQLRDEHVEHLAHQIRMYGRSA